MFSSNFLFPIFLISSKEWKLWKRIFFSFFIKNCQQLRLSKKILFSNLLLKGLKSHFNEVYFVRRNFEFYFTNIESEKIIISTSSQLRVSKIFSKLQHLNDILGVN